MLSTALRLTPLFLLPAAFAAASTPADPLAVARAAAAVVIRDTAFEFVEEPWQTAPGVQIIDFIPPATIPQPGPFTASTTFSTKAAGTYHFGFAGGGHVQLWIDDRPVVTQALVPASAPTEYAYDHFRWPHTFTADLSAGEHRLRVELAPDAGDALLYLQAATPAGASDSRVSFSSWTSVPARAPIRDFAVKPNAAFKQHSLAEWHYANGTTLLALLELAETGDTAARKHTQSWAAFTMENLPWQRRQFITAHAWRGANYRLFRGCLLDDTSAPALPLVELLRRGEAPPEAAPLVEDILDFVLQRHPRLADGTLARDEPEPQTVWADDLYMSTAFLSRAAAWKKDPLLWDEILRQVEGFQRHLHNPKTDLYWHGYYTTRDTAAHWHWGRANGWIAWAISDCLELLPADHPAQTRLRTLQLRHLRALLRLQASSGLWHQLLDDPGSYEETSATAMFYIALARGLRAGWLDSNEFAPCAHRAWAALQTRIDKDGVVQGICRGTGIGDSTEYYRTRPTNPHDPRGLGAYLTAAIEASLLAKAPHE
jgi:rhamnogalacturonyl hydrolase YesR